MLADIGEWILEREVNIREVDIKEQVDIREGRYQAHQREVNIREVDPREIDIREK